MAKFAATKGNGKLLSNVDVCKTQVGDSVIPLPYSNQAELQNAGGTADKVLIVGEEAIHLGSTINESTTDPPVTSPNIIGGVISGITNGKCAFYLGSQKVFIQGQMAVRKDDAASQNKMNCFGKVNSTSQTKVIING